MHFFNPVSLMQWSRALETSDAVCDAMMALVETLGKKARVSKDSYAFVVNRVLTPMINEATPRPVRPSEPKTPRHQAGADPSLRNDGASAVA